MITLTAKCTKNHLYSPKNVSYISRLHIFALSSWQVWQVPTVCTHRVVVVLLQMHWWDLEFYVKANFIHFHNLKFKNKMSHICIIIEQFSTLTSWRKDMIKCILSCIRQLLCAGMWWLWRMATYSRKVLRTKQLSSQIPWKINMVTIANAVHLLMLQF